MARSKKELEARLTPKQKKAAMMLLERQLSDLPELQHKTIEEIADELGVTTMTLWRWRQKVEFIEYQNLLGAQMLNSYQGEVFGILMEELRQKRGVKQMELFMKATGVLKNEVRVENVDSTRSKDDLEREMAEIDDLLNETDNEARETYEPLSYDTESEE